MASMNISVPDAMRDWVQRRIQSGEYASVSDYVRDLIRRDQTAPPRRLGVEDIRRTIEEGRAAGGTFPAEDVFARIRGQAAAAGGLSGRAKMRIHQAGRGRPRGDCPHHRRRQSEDRLTPVAAAGNCSILGRPAAADGTAMMRFEPKRIKALRIDRVACSNDFARNSIGRGLVEIRDAIADRIRSSSLEQQNADVDRALTLHARVAIWIAIIGRSRVLRAQARTYIRSCAPTWVRPGLMWVHRLAWLMCSTLAMTSQCSSNW